MPAGPSASGWPPSRTGGRGAPRGASRGRKNGREPAQASLFDLMAAEEQPALQGPQLEATPPAAQQQKLNWEKELLGIYLSEHPFARAAHELRSLLSCRIVELNAELAGKDLIIGGLITGGRTPAPR